MLMVLYNKILRIKIFFIDVWNFIINELFFYFKYNCFYVGFILNKSVIGKRNI